MGVSRAVASLKGGAVLVGHHGDSLIMCWRSGSVVIRVLSLLLLIPWTGLFGLILVSSDPVRFFLIAPMFAIWLLMAFGTAWAFSGMESLRIGPDGLEHRRRAIIELDGRQVPLEEIRGIAYWQEAPENSDGTLNSFDCLIFDTDHGSLSFFFLGLKAEENQWLANSFWEHLKALAPHRSFWLESVDPQRADRLATRGFGATVSRRKDGGSWVMSPIGTMAPRPVPSGPDPLWDPDLDGLPGT